MYELFYRLNANIDVIPVSRDFSTYKVLVIPVLQIVDETLAEKFKTFARSGGTIIFSFRTGLKNKQNTIHFKHILPAKVVKVSKCIDVYVNNPMTKVMGL